MKRDLAFHPIPVRRRQCARFPAKRRLTRSPCALLRLSDREALRIGEQLLPRVRIAQPPPMRIVQFQVLAEDVAGELRKIRT